MRAPVFILVVALCAALLRAPAGNAARSREFSVASDGPPTISGGLNATVVGQTSMGGSLQLTINFGEVSPLNPNRLVVVVVPVALRSLRSYEVRATLSGSLGADPNAVQLRDVGLGLIHLRPLGKFATVCGASSTIVAPLNNDPSVNVSMAGRAAYPSSLADIGIGRTLMTGPKLSTKNINNRKRNGYAVDAVLVLAPQFYSVGTFSVTLTLSMRPGPSLPCDG